MRTILYYTGKITLLLLLLTNFSPIFADNVKITHKGNLLFLVERGQKYAVDSTLLLAKVGKNYRQQGNKVKPLFIDKIGIARIPVPDKIRIEDYKEYLEQTNDYEYVEYNTIYPSCSFIPNDVGLTQQWYLNTIHAYAAWTITTGSFGIKVAVIDGSGIASSHPDIGMGSDNFSNIDISAGYNYVDNEISHHPTSEHGTMVAGIIAAKTNNITGIAGIAGGNNSSGSTIIPYQTGGYTSSIISAINDAVDKGANIINMSFGGANSNSIEAAIQNAYNSGITIVCSTGNDPDLYPYILYPASSDFTIAVGATNYNNQRASFSNYGPGMDLVAPGVQIYSTSYDSNTQNCSYVSYWGTSFSAPQVSGVIALMLSVNPNLTPAEIRNILRNSANKISEYTYTNGWNQEVGYGLLDAYKAVIQAFNIHVVGSDMVCGEEEYTISNLPAGAAVALNTSNSAGYSIQVSNNLSIVSYSDGLLTVQKVSTGAGYIFVYYKGHLLTTREVWVGVPIVNDVYFMGGNIYIETDLESTPDPRYFYIVINGRSYRLLGGVGIIPLTNGTYDVEAYTSNLCGESDHYFGQIVVYGSGLYSLGPISSDHQVSIETIDYSDSPQPLEAMQTMTSKQAAKDVPYELKNAMTGEVSARGKMPAEGGMLDFSRVRSGLYVLTLSPAGREPETFKLSLK